MQTIILQVCRDVARRAVGLELSPNQDVGLGLSLGLVVSLSLGLIVGLGRWRGVP